MALKAISTTAATLRRWPAPGQWTYQDYLDLPDDGYRYEVIWGELYMTPAPNTKHQQTLAELMFALQEFVKANNLGLVLPAPCDVLLEPGGTPVEPDILFISQERTHIITPKNVNGAPDLIVEILSPSNPEHDRQRKFKLYQESSVPEYWIVDPDTRTIEIFTLSQGRYSLFGRFGAGQAAASKLLAGFEVEIDRVIPGGQP
jgi:Uma2 family endonuclease